MDVFNLFAEQEWDNEQDRDGYRHRVTAIGKRLGAELLGASLYELPPGEATWPYHYEHGPEEWLLVVAGRPTLRTPEGERQLEPGDVVAFPQGPAGAHKVTNPTDETVRVVIFSSKIAGRGRRRIPTARRSASGRRRTATSASCATSRSSTTGTANRPSRASAPTSRGERRCTTSRCGCRAIHSGMSRR